MGGEKLIANVFYRFPIGSPPHGRGKDGGCSLCYNADRITPAWAGKRRCAPVRSPAVRDHPRMGGEKCGMMQQPTLWLGSPPHGRGKGWPAAPSRKPAGITPAWAGKSGWALRIISIAWDHPRMGGEKRTSRPETARRRGSPPHGRGKGTSTRWRETAGRITPAWAGKSFVIVSFSLFYWDHPRMGGEKQLLLPFAPCKSGSPPHGRGKGISYETQQEFERITPAWAGKSLSTPPQLVIRRDHPRMGGEKPFDKT